MGDRERAGSEVLWLGRGIGIYGTKAENHQNSVTNEDLRGTNWLYPVPVLSWLFVNVGGPLPVGWAI